MKSDLSSLSIGLTNSGAEETAKLFPYAKVAKAFNNIGMNRLNELLSYDPPLNAFICGNDPEAKGIVSKLTKDIDFSVVDTGDLVQAGYLEPLAMLWIHLAHKIGFGTNIAFKLLRI